MPEPAGVKNIPVYAVYSPGGYAVTIKRSNDENVTFAGMASEDYTLLLGYIDPGGTVKTTDSDPSSRRIDFFKDDGTVVTEHNVDTTITDDIIAVYLRNAS